MKPKVVVAAPIPLDRVQALNWDACCICQSGEGKLTCPAKNPVASRKNLGYLSVGENLEKLQPYLYKLESGFLVDALFVETSIANSLQLKNAKWHKNCSLKYLSPKFDNLIKSLSLPSTNDETSELQSAKSSEDSDHVPERRQTRSTLPLVNVKEEVCFFCKGGATKKYPLRHCATDKLMKKVKDCALIGTKDDLIGVLSEGDLVAIEGKYHPICLVRFYNDSSRRSCETNEDHEMVICEGIAFADLLIYVQSKLNENHGFSFQMGEIVNMYVARLAQLLGVPSESIFTKVHTTRLRNKILAHFPFLKAEKSGREYVLRREGTNILTALHGEDQDEDALAAHFFLKKVRKTMKESKVTFNGSFEEKCEEASIPAPLLAVVNSLLYGSPVQTRCRATQPALTICQLLLLNFHEKVPKGEVVRNKRVREPPLPLYMALSSYGRGRDKARIDEMHRMGISVSSDRVMEVTSQLCRLVVEQSKENNIVCPSNLRHEVFTVTAIDNLDVLPRSTTSKGSGFHGLGISIFQLRTRETTGKSQVFHTTFEDVARRGVRSVPDLPDFYSEIADCVLPKKQPSARGCSEEVGNRLISMEKLDYSWQMENSWLSHVHEYLEAPAQDCAVLNVSWAGYHAAKESESGFPPAINALLPLFHEKSSDPGMVKHAMNLVRNITAHLNQDQETVICGDQPVFALIKTIQWNWPEEYGEHKFVAMFGPLHIEQNFLKVLGQLLDGSGWVTIISHAGIATEGSAQGLLKVSHITKSRAAHQQTAAALHSLLIEAYENSEPDGEIPVEEWLAEKAKHFPTIKFWLTVLNLEILLLCFVRAIRKGDFDLYKKALKNMTPYFFSLNHPLYARWISVHLQDMEALSETAPIVYSHFQSGHFVVRKTGRPFSAMGIDQAHEQNNGSVKAHGGAVGLTEDPSSLRRWTIGGPEVRRLLQEFHQEDVEESHDTHHEQYPSFQRKFAVGCTALKESFKHFQNPFEMDTEELICLVSRRVVGAEGVKTLYALEETGTSMYRTFVKVRLIRREISVFDTINRVSSQIFTLPVKKTGQKELISKLKEDVHLFSRMFIISTARDLDLSEFFHYENQMCPPSLSLNGTLRPGNKSHLLTVLEKLVPKGYPPLSTCDGVVFDGAALVHQVKPPPGVKNMADYSENYLKAYILKTAAKFKAARVDVSWDLYLDGIKKAREARGEGLRQQDLPRKGTCPKNWENYLKNSENKSELFEFLAEQLMFSVTTVQIVTNVGERFTSSNPQKTGLMNTSCSAMEEADGRMILHVKDMVDHGARKVLICCSDTDVLVLGVSFYHSLKSSGLQELWFQFGVGSNRRFIPAHLIADNLGREKAEALRGFHAFTGCDSVSFFSSRGKRSAWSAWKDEFTPAFKSLGRPLSLNADGELDASITKPLEKFTIAMYTSDSDFKNVDEARKSLFCSGDKPITAIPPTRSALMQHIKRAAYQAGQIWGKADQAHQNLPSPQNWGWTRGEHAWQPLWSTLPPIWDACRELDRCGCKTNCETQRCCCRRYGIPCTPACKICKGQCCNKSARSTSNEAT